MRCGDKDKHWICLLVKAEVGDGAVVKKNNGKTSFRYFAKGKLIYTTISRSR